MNDLVIGSLYTLCVHLCLSIYSCRYWLGNWNSGWKTKLVTRRLITEGVEKYLQDGWMDGLIPARWMGVYSQIFYLLENVSSLREKKNGKRKAGNTWTG